METPNSPLTILSSTATGTVVPHSMQDVQQTLARMGHRVLVQDNAALQRRDAVILSIVDGLVHVEPDVFFTIDHVALLPEVLAVLDRPPKVLSWIFDDPMNFLGDDFLCINSHLHLFCWDRAYLPGLREKGFRHLYYQPFATNPDVYRPAEPGPYEYDVSFVGAQSRKRQNLLLLLAESGIRVDVFGDAAWGAARHTNLVYHGPASNREDCPRIYSRSRINLNITSDQLLTALPVRVFDVLACRGFLLTDVREDTEALFRPGRELATYAIPEELPAKVRHYLDRPGERDAIREAGHRRVLAGYTFEKILPLMLREALAQLPDLAANRAVDPRKLANTLWAVGTSYLKFGKNAQAYPRLLDALKLSPNDPKCLFSLALLANRTGQVDSAASCAERLSSLNPSWKTIADELVSPTRRPEPVSWFDRLYRKVFPGLDFQPGGTLAGWAPGAVSPER